MRKKQRRDISAFCIFGDFWANNRKKEMDVIKMLKNNIVSASVYAAEINSAARAYRHASARILARGEGGEPGRAASLCDALCMRAKSAAKNIYAYKNLPAPGGKAEAFMLAETFLERDGEANEANLCSCLASYGKKYDSVTLAVLPDALFAAAFVRISKIVCSGEEKGLAHLIHTAERLHFIDFSRVFLAFSATVQTFSSENTRVFEACDDKTKFKYISALLELCKKEGRAEAEMAEEIVQNANVRQIHIGELLFDKKVYVPRIYAVCLIFSTLLIAALYFLLCVRNIFALVTLPAAAIASYGMVKEILSVCFKYAGGDGLMRMSAVRARGEKAVVAVMSIITGRESDGELFERLENFYLSEENPNRFYAIVCNLPDSKKRKNAADEKIISSAFARIEALNKKYGAHFGIFVRERRYSRSERKYIGWERKRGAVLELCRFMRGEKSSITRYIANSEFLSGAKYLITLDADTNLYAGASDELVGTMLHPMNKPVVRGGAVVSGHAIIQPHISPTLESAASTAFATVTAGNGGIDSYAGAAFDIYENVFESGSFCGKGIIDVDVFLEVCGDFFRSERVLSHDLLEGNLTGAAIASDITLTDSAPKNATAYYTRQHRWLRGDLQTVPYLFSHVVNARGEKIKNPMSALSKYKITDNLLGAVCPYTSLSAVFLIAFYSPDHLLFAVPFLFANLLFPIVRAVIALFLPGGAKKAVRRFHSRVMPHIIGGFCYSFYKICALPYEAFLFGDAFVRTLYRFAVSKRNFLNWKTAAMAESEQNGLWKYVSSMWFSAAAGVLAFFTGELLMVELGALWLFFPFFAFLLSQEKSAQRELSARERSMIFAYTEEMWGFFLNNVNENTNFLPPDNCAYSPSERVAYRTSPTNIGLYLASLLGARDMGFITSEELCVFAGHTAATLVRLAKWRGHLYNWYDIKTLEILGEPFVSTVDSGNFAVSVCTFCEGLREYAAECPRLLDVLRVYEEIVKNMDFSALYNKGTRLFYIGYDVKKEKYSASFYDTFMSESRMTGFFAVATGQAPREHFFVPSRKLIGSGAYIGIASWSGTVFEYFMPALFLPTIENSLSEEALSFAYRMEKKNAVKQEFLGKRRKIFGVSESGYWHFDSEMNYQYKAFGVSELSLDPQGRSAPVVSPYSTFLMMRENPAECLANLETLEKMGAHGEYGFYEAVDCDKRRVGDGFAIVKSYMAHHVGMSFIAAVNMLTGDIFPRRFMRIPRMRAFRELLCEKIAVESELTPKKARIRGEEKEILAYRTNMKKTTGEKAKYNLLFPDVAMLSNNKLRLIASSSGHISIYNGDAALFLSDFERFSLGGGLRFYLWADGVTLPLVPLGASADGCESAFSFEYNDEKITYVSNHRYAGKALSATLTLRVCPDREMFFADLRASGEYKKAHFYVYGEPILQNEKSFLAHKSFSNLFLESKYSAGEEVLLFARRSKTGSAEGACLGVRATPHVFGGSFDTKRDEILPLMYGERDIARLAAGVSLQSAGAMIVPALSMKTYRTFPKGTCSFAFGAAPSEEEALFLLCEKDISENGKFADICKLQYGASGFSPNQVFLKNFLLRSFLFCRARTAGTHARYARDIFWRHGISGENHTVAALFPSESEEAESRLGVLIRLFKYMCICGERFDLIVIYDENDQYRGAQKEKIEHLAEREGCRGFLRRDCGIHPLCESAITAEEKAAILRLAELQLNLAAPLEECTGEGFFEISDETEKKLLKKTVTRSEAREEYTGNTVANVKSGTFTENGFAVRKGHGSAPFATVAVGGGLGFTATENSLGFTFRENAALGKLTPHTADNMREDGGEKLILRIYDGDDNGNFEDYDLCACAYSAEFGENGAIYKGKIAEMQYTAEARLDNRAPVKKISVCFGGSVPLNAEISLVLLPCLGEKREKTGRYIYERTANALYVSSVFENPLTLALCAEKSASFISDEAELISGGKVCGGEEIAAVCKKLEKGENTAAFYFGALGANFVREDFEAFVFENKFEACESAPIFESVKIKTRNALFDLSVNRLFPYQTYYSRFVGRTGFYQVGGAYGFRDQLQDSLSFLENAPLLCREQLLRAAAHQYEQGDAAHWWHSYAGKETGLRSRYSDDLLWLPFALCEYVEKTGDESLLTASAPYLSSPPLDAREHERYETLETEGEGTVLEHALLAARLAWERGFGAHGLLKFGGGDWNDGMNLVGVRGDGESVWLTEFCAIVYSRLSRLLQKTGDTENAKFFGEGAKKLYEGFSAAFDSGWYLRGYYDSGAPLGKSGNAECEVDSLSQSFAVFAELELFGKVSERTRSALSLAAGKLYDKEKGIMKLLSPPFDKGGEKPGYIKGYLPGIRENGGQYTHAAVWAAMALLLSGQEEKGFEILKSINPALKSKEDGFCKRYKIEPYALAGDVYSHPECVGRGGWSHYTGAAGWYRKAVIETVFGLCMRGDGFYLVPHMTEFFDRAELLLDIRGTRYRVRYFFGEQSGIVLDGKILESDGEKTKKCFFSFDGGEHTVDLCMRKEV